MTTFGDLEPDDVADTAPADPVQVAIHLHRLRLAHSVETRSWLVLDDHEREVLVWIVEELLIWWRRQGLS